MSQWSLGAAQPAKKSNTALIVIVICAVVGGMLLISCVGLGILLPALGKARQTARQMKSAVQLRSIGLALQLYANDNKGWLPEVGADWRQRLLKDGTITPDFLVAPSAEPGQESYFYVPGQKLTVSPTMVLAYENPELNRGRGANVLFMDMHVEWIPKERLSAVIDTLKLPDGKAFAPHKGVK